MIWNIDQDTMQYLWKFYISNRTRNLGDPFGTVRYPPKLQLSINPFEIILSYKPKKMDWTQIPKQNWSEILQMGSIHNLSIPIQAVHIADQEDYPLYQADMWKTISKFWFMSAQDKLPSWISKIEPFRYLTTLPKHLALVIKHSLQGITNSSKWSKVSQDLKNFSVDLLEITDKTAKKTSWIHQQKKIDWIHNAQQSLESHYDYRKQNLYKNSEISEI